MGKNLRQQRRGKGSPRYRSPDHRFLAKPDYRQIPSDSKNGIIKKLLDAPGRTTPLAVVEFSGLNINQIAHEGATIGGLVDLESASKGSIIELKDIPEGSKIYNIEIHPGDGGRLCRSSGSFATVITKEGNKCVLLLPSKRKKLFSSSCRATIGIPAGSGRISKPFRKAGNKHYARKAFGRLYPTVRGVAMNPVDHPFGGSAKPGKHKTVSRSMPPGKKVGSIAARRMGKKKRK